MASQRTSFSALGRQRLMQDLSELVEKPYPNIYLHVRDEDMSSACLILSPENQKPLHLTIQFNPNYPLSPPGVRMNSKVLHPNVFENGYICATILRDGDGYTPAYTLKGIAIQMLSFFASDKVEQDYGNDHVTLEDYRATTNRPSTGPDFFFCRQCGFGVKPSTSSIQQQFLEPAQGASICAKQTNRHMAIGELPDELLLALMEELGDFQDLVNLARAWPRVSRLMTDWDIIRQRELQCFCLKRTFKEVNLGVGVSVNNRGQIESEFDLLSSDAYRQLCIRTSVHGLEFRHWLPLPISRGHWHRVRQNVKHRLEYIKHRLPNSQISDAQVIQHFMSDVVVRLNLVADETHQTRNNRYDYYSRQQERKSTLKHASEKAIESYFHLFHLLLCVATEDPSVVTAANTLLRGFVAGKRSKTHCPNLGHLLVALLISDVEVTSDLIKAIITEAITRNVVWLLDRKGAGNHELSFLETDKVSVYRLKRTFEGSRTSYRLLMFSELFRRTARPASSNGRKSLAQIRDELFDRHGSPPPGAAAHLAAEVRRIQTIEDFPVFIQEMGIRPVPTAESFTTVLRNTVIASMENGYSRWAFTQEEALLLRVRAEPLVSMPEAIREWVRANPWRMAPDPKDRSFFPEQGARQNDRGGRGSGRGGGRGGARGRGHGPRGRGRGHH